MKNIYQLFAVVLALCLPVIAFSKDLPPKEKVCPNNDCRGPITIKLIKEDGSVFEQKYEYLYPIVQPIGISIFPGEEINITGTFENNKLVNIRALKDSDQEQPLFTFNFKQDDKDMILQVVNKANQDIKYHLQMMPLKKEKLAKTSSCPVPSGKTGIEAWPYPIYQLLITEIFVVDTNNQMNCEY